MKRCSREAEVVATLRLGGWPLGAEPELRRHVEECRRCSETALIGRTLLAAAAADPHAAPKPGTLWWRAQLERQRRDVASALRPLSWAGGVAAVALLAGMIAMVAWQLPPALAWMRQLGSGAWLALLGGLATLCATSLAAWLCSRRDA